MLGYVGFRVVVLLICAHVLESVHHAMAAQRKQRDPTRGVPDAWPGFCGSFDLTAAVMAAWRMQLRGVKQTLESAATPP